MKTLKMKWMLIGVISLLIPREAMGQEVQVPFFPVQNIETIDRGYARRMSLFTEYEGFVEARMFLIPGNRYAVEVYYEKNDSLYKDRQVLAFAEKEQYLRDLVSQYAEQVSPDTTSSATGVRLLNQQGRSSMLVMNTITGLSYYGPALPLTLGVEETKAFVGLYMLSAGASFYIPYRITQNRDVSLAQASFTFYGQSRGILHGIFLGELLTRNIELEDYPISTGAPYPEYDYERYDEDQDKKNQVLFGMGILGSVTGGIAGFQLAERWQYDGGSTSIFQMWGDVGTISGMLIGDLFNFWEKDTPDALFGTMLGTSAAGMVAGKFFGDSRNYTLGDAIVYRSTILLGCFAPVTLVHYFEPEEFKAYSIAGLAGMAAGSYFGWRSTLNRDFSTSDGVFVALGELAGGLVGLGLGYLIAPEDSDGKVILTTATVGAFGGYGLMYSQLNKRAMDLSTSVDLDLGLNPLGLLMNRQRPVDPRYQQMYSLVNARLRF